MARSEKLTHLDAQGRARMVDVAGKEITVRTALAQAVVHMLPATLRALRSGRTPKGDVLAVARIAGIQAAKRTPELIPMCHHVQLTAVNVEITPKGLDSVRIEARASASDRTGVEMEALVAASTAALTIYDMLKAIDRGMVIDSVCLVEKTGGKSGDFKRAASESPRKAVSSARAAPPSPRVPSSRKTKA